METIRLKLEEAKEINDALKTLAPCEPDLIEWEEELVSEVISCEREIEKQNVTSDKEKALKKSKEKMIKTRISDIKDSISKNCSKAKIDLLATKLKESYNRTKQILGQ